VDFFWGRSRISGPGSDFLKLELGRRVLYLKRDLVPKASVIIARLGELRSSTAQGAGNRASGHVIHIDDRVEIFARRARRGGLMRFLLNDLYFGVRPRPLRELAVAVEAYRRGIPTAEPLGAMVESVATAIYRGFFLTRAIRGMTLWEFVRTDDDPVVRSHVLEQARRAIDTMHQKGLFHADLNLHNLFVTQAGESFATIILDLDKARLFHTSVPAGRRRLNLARLRRSARKLDPEGRYLDEGALALLTGS
jgi:3-deoxy-D-manno-octulosonic acid kinase